MSSGASASASVKMDRMYRWQRHFYDFTRKPYLLGRDRLIEMLGAPAGGRVLEIGCGTGRNLVKAARRYPDAHFYGFDIAQVMLDTAARSVRQAGLQDQITLAQGDAAGFSTRDMFAKDSFERVFISYSLSMIPEWRTTLAIAVQSLAPGGALLIADFYDGRNLPGPARALLAHWLRLFEVYPRHNLQYVLEDLAQTHHLNFDFQPLYGGYAAWAMLRKPHHAT